MFDSSLTNQLLFIYHKDITQNKGLIVQFIKQDEITSELIKASANS